MSKDQAIDFSSLPNAEEDGMTHVNTLNHPKSVLGQVLMPSFEIGGPIEHPMLGSFRSVENLCCYLNTGGTRDNIRMLDPHTAINRQRLSKKFSCDKFRDLVLDLTILKLQSNSTWVSMMAENELPFDHYYVIRASGLPVRPTRAALFVSIYNDVRKILRGEKNYELVKFKDMNFRELK